MDANVSVFQTSPGFSEAAFPNRRRESFKGPANFLKFGHHVLLAWDTFALGAAGIACDAAFGLWLGGATPGWHEEALQLTCIGPVLAPFVLRDRSVMTAGMPGAHRLLSRGLLRLALLGLLLLAIGLLTQGFARLPQLWMGARFGCTLLAVTAGRLLYMRAMTLASRSGVAWERVALVGSGPTANWFRDRIGEARCPGLQLVATYETHSPAGDDLDAIVAELVGMGRRGEIDRVVLALSGEAEARTLQLAHRLKVLAVEVTTFCPPPGYARLRTTEVAGVPQVVINGRPHYSWGGLAKAIEDRLLSLLLLLWLAPLLVLIAVAIRLDSPGPIIFRQKRHGRNGCEFEVLKFRTMRWQGQSAASGAVQTCRGDRRITGLGALLRNTSLDELPQLFNVLHGTMSLVGPRPHPVVMRTEEQLGEEIIAEYAHRHRVKPGITGWAQINGYRGATETAEQLRKRVEHDIHYIDNCGIM